MTEPRLQRTLSLAERAVPRYTSYPTAPHFSPAVGPDDTAAWLGALPPQASLSVYLHVPFCAELCAYCGCHTKAVRRREPVDAYAADLASEIDVVGALSASRRIVAIHWGGGTPSMLGEAGLSRLVDRLGTAFELADLSEHAIELDPRSVTPSLARTLARIGVTRASFGVQDLSPDVQAAIGRIQPFEVVARAVHDLRDAGIAAINLDLMYGLPRQGLPEVRRTAELAASLAADRLAIFGYAHVPWFKTHQRLIRDDELPDTQARLAQSEAARSLLVDLGYVEIGIDHFARPEDPMAVATTKGELQRNFQGYTTDTAEALIGLGASSIGKLPQGFVQNAPDVGGWARAVRAGRPATVRGIAFSAEDRLRAEIITRLMCDFAVDLATLAPGRPFGQERAELAELVADGLVTIEGQRIAVTRAGRPFVRLVAAAFDAYLGRGAARHSVAV